MQNQILLPMVLRKACARAPLQGLSESTRKPLKAYLRKGVIPLNASLLKGTAFLLHSKKHYNRRPGKEVTFSKTGDKTRSGRLRHNQEFEIEIKLCNTTNRGKNSIILYYLCLYDDSILTKPV